MSEGHTAGRENGPKQRASYLRPDQVHALRLATRPLYEAFGTPCYHVGSSLVRPDFRDVDVRLILTDERFAAIFGPELDQFYSSSTPLWALVCTMLSQRLAHETGLPIDFQIQAMTPANEQNAGPRQALIDPALRIRLPGTNALHRATGHDPLPARGEEGR